jgi:hypothetical protein
MRGLLAALLLTGIGLAVQAQESMTAPPAEAGQGGSMMMSGAAARIIPFTDLSTARYLAARAPTVFFFQDPACQSCQAAMRELQAGARKLGQAVVIVVDYDRAAELKKLYGVKSVHTWVRIDADGRELASWSGGGLEELLRKVGS